MPWFDHVDSALFFVARTKCTSPQPSLRNFSALVRRPRLLDGMFWHGVPRWRAHIDSLVFPFACGRSKLSTHNPILRPRTIISPRPSEMAPAEMAPVRVWLGDQVGEATAIRPRAWVSQPRPSPPIFSPRTIFPAISGGSSSGGIGKPNTSAASPDPRLQAAPELLQHGEARDLTGRFRQLYGWLRHGSR